MSLMRGLSSLAKLEAGENQVEREALAMKAEEVVGFGPIEEL
jgi:hypothetical protein